MTATPKRPVSRSHPAVAALLLAACLLAPRIADASPPPRVEVRPPSTPPESDDQVMLIIAGALTGVGWISRSISIGIGMRYPGFCVFGECEDPSRSTAWRVFTYAPPFLQLTATGFAAPGGIVAGRLDAWRAASTGLPKRRGRALVIAGAVLFGVFTAGSIALRPAVLLTCFAGTGGCENATSYVAYSLAAQTSDTLSTLGAGMLGYGVAYQRARTEYARPIAFAPWSERGAYGVAVGGRF